MVDLSLIGVNLGADVLDQLIEMARPQTGVHQLFLSLAINARGEAIVNAEAELVEAERINEQLQP